MNHHEMQVYCPKPRSSQGGAPCGTPMTKRTERGVTIDVCPRDNSVVLDAGELERITATLAVQPGFNPHAVAHAPVHHGGSSDHGYGYGHGGSSDYHRRHNHGSGGFFDRLFD
ncbi:MAG TPA: hypothetical protein VFT59_02200 [Candidatus Saccharimonadales bacterium]|nr:hypothetical protein [Candidatus Saccharimonadales bacterium]